MRPPKDRPNPLAEAGTTTLPPDTSFWNADFEPPVPGTRVNILAWREDGNDPGILGTVEGYQVFSNWLMVWVRPDWRPQWHRESMPDRYVCLFAGIELKPVEAK
jgi:hypothetical protein